ATNNGNLDAQVKSAQAQVVAAAERLKSDLARLELTELGPTDEAVQQAQAEVDQAVLQVQKARTPYTSFDVLGQEQAVVQAYAQLQKTLNPYTDKDLAAAASGVDQAQAQVDLAQIALDDAAVVAPVDGVI